MKIKFLGTAAAEGIPGMFCTCDVCKRTWLAKGKNIRTRSQAIIDDKLLIDFNADSYLHSIIHNVHLSEINHIFITHIHEDHYYPDDLANRKPGFAHIKDHMPLNIYGSDDINEPVLNNVKKYCGEGVPNELRINCLKAFNPISVDGYEICPIKAVHGTDNPFNYIIKKDGKTMLYAHDTSSYRDETWDFINKYVDHFDLLSLDCTAGVLKMGYEGHMNIERDLEFRNKLIYMGKVDDKTICVANHFSHNCGATYDELCAYVKEMPILISYDGMEIEF